MIFPLLTLILWRGAGARLLTAACALLLGVAVPLLYLIETPINRGGYNFEYSLQTLDAHWVTEGALVLLMVACWRAISGARAAREVSPPTAPQAAPAPHEPAAAQSSWCRSRAVGRRVSAFSAIRLIRVSRQMRSSRSAASSPRCSPITARR